MPIIFVIVLLSFDLVLSQNIPNSFKHITVEDGLSSSQVNKIIQDHQGFLWFATEDGLNKYDGYSFKVFRHDPEDTNSISHNMVYDIIEDDKNNIWAATWFGLSRYDPYNDKFIRYYTSDDDTNSISGSRQRALFQDSKKRIWIGTWPNGLNLYIKEKDHFIRFIQDSTLSNNMSRNRINKIYEDHNQQLWIGTKHGLYKFDPDSNSFTPFLNNPTDKYSISNNEILSIAEDKNGDLWIGTGGGGLNKFNPLNNKFYLFENIPVEYIPSIYIDNEERLWVGTNSNGLYVINNQNNSVTNFRNDTKNPSSISGNYISSVFQDRNGIVWFGSTGLNQWNPRLNQFNHINQYTFQKNNLNNIYVKAIYKDAENLWIGTEAGVNIFLSDKRGFKVLKNEPGNKNSLSNNNISGIVKDKNGHFWISTYEGGLNKYNPRNNTFTRFIGHQNYPQMSTKLSLYTLFYENENIWIATEGFGTYKYSLSEDKFYQLSDTVGIWPNTFYKDSRGIIWIGGYSGGLFAYHPGYETQGRYFFGEYIGKRNNDIVNAICEDDVGDIWLGTASGLFRFTPPVDIRNSENVEYEIFGLKDGLPNDMIYGILKDDNHNLWLSTNKGLSKFNYSARTFMNYTVDDGLQSDQFFFNSFTKDAQGYMYFGGTNGYNVFHPDSITENETIPPIVITSLRIFDKSVNFLGLNNISLDHDQNFISFEFAALDYTAPQKNQYAYKMDGLDKDWINPESRRYASYTNLSPGRYTFRVKGSNNDGLWNEEGTYIHIYISPPFWQTLWFIVLMLTIISLIILSLHNYRVEQLLKVEKIRVRIASDLHDDVGSTLTKISMFSDLIKAETNPVENNEMLTKISDMSRSLISTMSDIVWAVDQRKDNFGELMERMKEAAFSAAKIKNIETHFEMINIDPDKQVTSNVRQNIYLIFKEAINNIVKHSKAGKVDVIMKIVNDELELKISDNGQGLPLKRKSSGNGLNNMQLRAKHLNGNFKIESNNGLLLSVKNVKI